uniref:Unannotated protein n=1 Tax=freshwater metagenome TaxID=449393 RepID=A0A6J5ZTH5_9ZZZZ
MVPVMDTALMVHGFAGTSGTWLPVTRLLEPKRYRAVIPDLRGHGQNSAVRPISFELCVDDLLAAAPPRFTIAGYSLGGRLALQAALKAPERIERLILISTTAGLEDPALRAQRLESDLLLAERLKRLAIGSFADQWLDGDLFRVDRPEVNLAARGEILKNRPGDLAAALSALSVGRMEPMWSRLGELAMPVDVVAGERDERYVEIAEQLAGSIGDAVLHVVPAGTHALPRSDPQALAAIL